MLCILQAIHGYRETERLTWNNENSKILERVRNLAFPPGVGQLRHVHILDLDKKGYIKPHIDAIRVRLTFPLLPNCLSLSNCRELSTFIIETEIVTFYN